MNNVIRRANRMGRSNNSIVRNYAATILQRQQRYRMFRNRLSSRPFSRARRRAARIVRRGYTRS